MTTKKLVVPARKLKDSPRLSWLSPVPLTWNGFVAHS